MRVGLTLSAPTGPVCPCSGGSASPVAVDGKIYCAGEDGIVFVLEAGERFKPPKEHQVGETLMASPALSDGVMYLRGTRTLFAVGKKKSQ